MFFFQEKYVYGIFVSSILISTNLFNWYPGKCCPSHWPPLNSHIFRKLFQSNGWNLNNTSNICYQEHVVWCIWCVFNMVSLSQWLNFKLFGITYLVGKISSNFFFSGSIGWVSGSDIDITPGSYRRSWWLEHHECCIVVHFFDVKILI